MGIVGSISRNRKAAASALVIALLAGVPVAFAVLHDGFPVSDVDLQARDVWVTNGDALLGGRLNRQIEELDGSVSGQSAALDVVQNPAHVFVVDPELGAVARVDPAYTTLVEPVDIPPGSSVALGGSTLAILSPRGQLWALDVANALVFDPTSIPAAELGRGGLATVTTEGVVLAASFADQIALRIEAPGIPATSTPLAVPEKAQIAAVGDRMVLFDETANRLVRADGETVELPDAAYRLQQTGPARGEVVLATATALLYVADGGAVRTVSADLDGPVAGPDDVSAPVAVDGCVHGAWGGAQRYLLVCDDDDPVAHDIPQRTQGSRLEFRVNGSVVALNDLDNGNVWLLDDEMRLVANWDEVTPPEEQETEDGDEKASTQSFEDTLAERTETNRPPIARDDEYGVRDGRTTILAVLDNDTDPDGDVLTIARHTEVPAAVGIIDVIDGGRALQFTPALGATSASFRYTIDDGRAGGVAEASVTVRVTPHDSNAAPAAQRETLVSVESGGAITYNVLGDFRDPDGDDIYLADASPASSDIVRFTPDGTLTFEHRSGEPGVKEVAFTVSDGVLASSGVLAVSVEPRGSLAPIGTPDFATAFVGESVAIEPLKNDIAPNGEALTLLDVDDVPTDAIVAPNRERGTVTFQAAAAGTYYFLYSLAAGPSSSIGIVRVDVLPDPQAILPPIAVKDTAFLRAGEPTIVEVLVNDGSPDGSVLAVQSVDTGGIAPGVTVEALGNAVIRISSSGALTTQTQFRYTVSDGAQSATAGVTVVPVPPIVNRQPPIARDDRVRVRAGDVASADVLANDEHPDQSLLVLAAELVETADAGDGLVFVGDGTVRYQAGETPGEFSVVYRVADQYGESATARVTFVVVGADDETNQPPVPLPQTARVFAGATIPIELPLDGIDPDGDSVVIVGLERTPALGVVDAVSPTSIQYTADRAAGGTDTIGYVVEDSFGAQAVGILTIGVIPRPDSAPAPNAVDDQIEMKPGRTATVAVGLNDSDPSGYEIEVLPDLLEVDPALTATVDGSKIVVEAPEAEGTYTVRYAITNNHGGEDDAFLIVRVTENAAPVFPTALDYFVPVDDIAGEDSVAVDLDGLIGNPAGLDGDLVVTLEGTNAGMATVEEGAQTVVVRPGERRAAIAYRVTNPDDGLTATAFIVVPPAVGSDYAPPPRLRSDLGPQVIQMNGSREWDLADIVVVPSEKPPILVDAESVTATHSDGSDLVVDGDTIRFTASPDFRGIASITFRVTDGATGDDPDGREALLTMGLIVGDPEFADVPPAFTTQTVTIEAGEAARVVDLRASTAHPNPAVAGDFQYSGLSGQTADIAADISGGTLSISAPLGVQPGATATLAFTVRYRDYVVPGTVRVTVVRSTRPLTQAVEDAEKGRRGVSDTVDVLANDYNPFAADGQPLRVLSAVIENAAESQASVDFTADGEVTVQPGSAFIGVVSVVYTVEDATRDAGRQVQGRLLYTVRDVPGKVATPTFVEGDRQVTLEWDAPATNGEPITQYTLLWSGGSPVTVPGSSASYTFTGLTNGDPYTFQVRATNAVGQGEISDPSATARPFGAPSAVTSATATGSSNGSGDVILNWSGAGGNGRTIDGYRITVSPGGAVVSVGNVTTTTVPGRVGTASSYSIVTLGPGGESAPFSSTNAGTPRPGPPASASASWSGTRGDRTVTFSWTAAPSTEPITRYEILVNNYHSSWQNVGSATSYQITDATLGQSYSIQVRAVSAGQTGDARTSNSVTPLAPVPASYALCWHNDYAGYYNVGIRYANTSPGIQLKVDFANSTGTTTGANGTVRLRAWHAGGLGDGADTDNDDNDLITILVNGSAYSTTRWGDAPAC
ncbi:MAG: Ig-like domain-containing protein [Pseudolysinimonas sp.]|uniref:Ig-like domain-containing protein n=1 Tax=Pseudolysinimonas sp. TaxID=2680009 RepID=UPI003C737A47